MESLPSQALPASPWLSRQQDPDKKPCDGMLLTGSRGGLGAGRVVPASPPPTAPGRHLHDHHVHLDRHALQLLVRTAAGAAAQRDARGHKDVLHLSRVLGADGDQGFLGLAEAAVVDIHPLDHWRGRERVRAVSRLDASPPWETLPRTYWSVPESRPTGTKTPGQSTSL